MDDVEIKRLASITEAGSLSVNDAQDLFAEAIELEVKAYEEIASGYAKLARARRLKANATKLQADGMRAISTMLGSVTQSIEPKDHE